LGLPFTLMRVRSQDDGGQCDEDWNAGREDFSSQDVIRRTKAKLFARKTRKMLKRVCVFCNRHALPIALVVLAALSTGMQFLSMPMHRASFTRTVAMLAKPQPFSMPDRATATESNAMDGDIIDVFDLDQLNSRECKSSNLQGMRARISSLEETLSSKEVDPAEASMASLMQDFQPVDPRAAHEAEQAFIKKMLR
jgi:hypothetical protein